MTESKNSIKEYLHSEYFTLYNSNATVFVFLKTLMYVCQL